MGFTRRKFLYGQCAVLRKVAVANAHPVSRTSPPYEARGAL